MKKCTRCQIEQPKSNFETARKRICNDCSEIMETTKRNRVAPPQKLSDEEFTAKFLKKKEVKKIPHTKTVYTPATKIIPTGEYKRTNFSGDRVYRFLNKTNGGSIDEAVRNYG